MIALLGICMLCVLGNCIEKTKMFQPICSITSRDGHIKADCRDRSLTYVPQHLQKDIQILDLSFNSLTSLQNFSFSNYTNLIEVDLSHNIISNLEIGCFHPLRKLEVLNMNHNLLENISHQIVPEIFAKSTNLFKLDIRRNMNKLAKYVQSEYIYPGKALSILSNLSHLYMDLLPRPVFGPEFKLLLNLKVLAFDNCFLAVMGNETFRHMSGNLSELHLSHCHKILGQSVEFGFLHHFPNLKVLNLADTHIHLTRALRLLYPLANTKMDVINLQRVSYGPADMFSLPYALSVTSDMMRYLRTICVKTLNLANNGIVDFRENSLLTYDHPECFENIVFSANRFTVHSGHKLKEMYLLIKALNNIELFDFSYNPIRYGNEKYLSIPNGDVSFDPDSTGCIKEHDNKERGNITFFLPQTLKTLRISHFLRESCGESVVLKNLSSLTNLDMSYFNFVRFPKIYIIGENNLKVLNFSGIDSSLYVGGKRVPLFDNVEEAYFRRALLGKSHWNCIGLLNLIPNVRILDISFNFLWSVPSEAFSNNVHLKELNLSNNVLHEVPAAITNIKKLSVLNLRMNNLITINETITNWLDSLSEVRNITLLLKHNVFSCTCENRKFLRWLFTTKVLLENDKNYSCHLANGMLSNTIDVHKNYHDLFIDCDSRTWLRVGITLLVTFTIIALPATIIFNFRWRIAYFIFRKFKTVLESKMNLSFSYDAYVSYADDSSEWVKDYLLQKAEKEWGLSLCIDDRDLLGGKAFTDIIAEAISTSRQVIFVLTPGFLEKEWSSYEIERAKYEKAQKHVQVTLLNINMNVDDIPQAFSSIWHEVCIIDWSDNLYSWNSPEWDKLKLRLILNR